MNKAQEQKTRCNGKCRPTIGEYDKNCLSHGWIDEADEVLYKNLHEVDPCYDRNDRLTDKAKIGIYNAMREYKGLQSENQRINIELSNYAYQMDMAKRDRDKAESEKQRLMKELKYLRESKDGYIQDAVELKSLRQSILESSLRNHFPGREMSFHDKVVLAIGKQNEITNRLKEENDKLVKVLEQIRTHTREESIFQIVKSALSIHNKSVTP